MQKTFPKKLVVGKKTLAFDFQFHTFTPVAQKKIVKSSFVSCNFVGQ
jgi:hypothetical protein